MTDPDNCAACGGGDCVRSCDRNLALCKPRPASDPYVPQNAVGAQAMTRGGSYRRIACHQRLFVRRARNAESAASDLGFRCARSL